MAKQPTRQYIFTEQQTRFLFVGSGIAMVATLFTLLILSTSRPRGEFTTNLDRSTYLTTVQEASDSISEYRENADGTVNIPIERAMELVVERGVVNPFGSE